jgi:hypothetical protein
MLRRFALTVMALAALVAASTAEAQGAGADRRPFGFGIGANASFEETTGAFPYEIYFPLRLGPVLKIEPSIGLVTGDSDGGGDFSDVTLGVGVFAVRRVSAPVDLYFGGRLKLGFVSEEIAGDDESDTDFYVSAAAGGEYFVVPAFSLGLEANLGYYALGDLSGDQTGLYTTGIFFLRMYL